MDIVDTFNHLIPSEHLDDALFLGSNLEGEGTDDFATSQHVIEDSLKNMLSDKDPMLGSASTQFCLPVLDNPGHNFQIPPTTGVALDDIMDVGVEKVTPVDMNDEDDLILPDKNINQLNDPCMNSQRKSARLKAHESTRTLRSSTVEKTLNPAKVDSPKKSKASKKDTAAEKQKEHSLLTENDEDKSKCIPNSRRSSRLAKKELEDKTKEQNISEMPDDGLNALTYILANTQSVLENENDPSKAIHDESLHLISDNSDKVLHELNDSQHMTDGVLEAPENDKESDSESNITDDRKTDIIYDKVHQELALLSGVAECNLGVKTGLHPKMLQNVIDISLKENSDFNDNKLTSSEILCTNDKCDSAGDISILDNIAQNLPPDLANSQAENPENEKSSGNENLGKQNRKGTKKRTSSSARQTAELEISVTKNTVPSKDGSVISGSHKDGNKKAKITSSESQIEDKSKIIKVTKKRTESAKVDNAAIKTTLKKKPHLAGKRSSSSTLLTQLDEALRENVKETSQVGPSRTPSRSLSHSSDKSVTKHSSSKASNQAKDTVEQREAADYSEEKSKLKKSLPPRQRRSSKSVSVDEPPLFIPDNIPAVKKDGTEGTSPTDKYVWNPTRHCSLCRKLHGNRFMVGCGRCDDWFHGECVGLSLAQAQQMEVDDKEFVCIKCCAEEEKMEISETPPSDDTPKLDVPQDPKMVETDKPVTAGCPGLPHEKSNQADDALKHKVKISKKTSGENKQATERKDLEMKKHASDRKSLQSATASHRVSEEKREKLSKESSSTTDDEKTSKSGVSEKQDIKRKKPERKGSSSGVPSSSPTTPKPSIDQIRQSVRQSLKEILLKRLSESSSKIPEERASKVSGKIEKELFSFYRDTDSKYKNKYRSLMFNLKDPKNNVLFKRVLRGDITPEHLIKMTPEELASKELAAWRQRENRHTIEMIEKQEREVERRPITKITHKGEIEIESDAPMKEPEAMETEEESVLKPVEKEEEPQKDIEPLPDSLSDTTAQHKNHLFDLNCKICTGRMAPPAEDLSPKKVKLPVAVRRKQSEEAENISETSTSSIFKTDSLEIEKPESPKETLLSSSMEPFTISENTEDESTFLSRLTYIWKGYLNMPSVAKFVIKAYPVSGSLDHLSEDLPESIQVGGRISPQTVWDYVEKIKASGTKETCVIRFCPETEEDQISYTLLYSYFSSRKRYGVVANNMRQVKDMYLIPLGASEKIPHFFVPFDGPGLETRRPNLLLALIIRQKVKRQHIVNIDEDKLGTLISVPEKRSKMKDADADEDDDENDFFNSFSTVLHKNRNRSQASETDEPQQSTEKTVPEVAKKEPSKPLRFLPGVLVGWENPQSTIDLASKPLPDDDILQSLLGTSESTFERTSAKMGDKTLKGGNVQDNSESLNTKTSLDEDIEDLDVTPNTVKETEVYPALSQSEIVSLSLKDKPPDVSTEVYLSRIKSNDETVDNINSTEPADSKHETDTTSDLSPAPENKSSTDENSTSPVGAKAHSVKSSKPIHIKRDPRQAAGRSRHHNSSDSKDHEKGKNEINVLQAKETMEASVKHKKDKTRKTSHEESELATPRSGRSKSNLFSSTKNEMEIGESSRFENAKSYPPDLLIDETDPLQQFRRALAANKSQSSSSSEAETVKNVSPVFTGNFSPIRLQQPPFSPLKSPPPFPFQHTPSFPLPGNPIFPYPPHIPPLLPTPLGIGFPRLPRFPSAESGIHNPLVWHPTLQMPQQPHFLGHVTSGPLLNSEPVMYQTPPKLYSKDIRVNERRHSDPWEKEDRDRTFSRGNRSERRQRFYSESHHSREKRHEKELGSEKYADRDSDRSRRRDREKERSRDRDRKSRDDSHREKERSRGSHRDKSSDRTSRERRSSEKSKNDDRVHDKDKSRERNKDRDDDKERDRHHRDRSRERSDKSKSKR